MELSDVLFGNCRYKCVFIYHNGAGSYYSGGTRITKNIKLKSVPTEELLAFYSSFLILATGMPSCSRYFATVRRATK